MSSTKRVVVCPECRQAVEAQFGLMRAHLVTVEDHIEGFGYKEEFRLCVGSLTPVKP